MAPFEWLAAIYFAGIAAVTPVAGVSRRRRAAVSAVAALVALAIAAIARSGLDTWRAWLPVVYLVAGYWMPALLTRPPSSATRFERWLAGTDARLRPRVPPLSPALVPATELAYFFCYPLVPASFLVVWIGGAPSDVARFWVAVLSGGYACYASLPWLLSRPPRLVTAHTSPARRISAMNAFVLGRVSHRLNTFPSGHVAVSFAAAGGVWPVSPEASIAVAVIAAAVAAGAVAGRYHYVVDVLLGFVVAAAALGMARFAV
jgi:membrane-associated phospholipid phosphatase